MNGAHAHLIFNHIPVIGVLFGIAFLLVGVLRRRDLIIKSALWIFLAVSIAATLAFITGEPAEKIVEHLPGIAEAVIGEHEEAAEKAFISSIVLGLLALAGLAMYHRKAGVSRLFLVAAVACSLLVGALMAWTANLGGQIHHPEIRSGTPAVPEAPAGAVVEDDD
jgi:uncharacterized membrane protein